MMYMDITRNILFVFGAIGVVLIAATFVSETMARTRPSAQMNEVRLRVRSWWVLLVLFGLAVLGNRVTTLLFFAFVSFLALKEYFTLIPTRRVDRTLLFWVYLAIPAQYYFAYIDWYGMFIIFIPVYMFLFLPLHMVIAGSPTGFLRSVGTLNWGLMMTVFSLSHAAYLDAPRSAGAGLLLYLVLLTEFNDVFQFLWGRAIGRRKVTPTVSPGKTWRRVDHRRHRFLRRHGDLVTQA
jgi:phosphatidate cytidylyltransferase